MTMITNVKAKEYMEDWMDLYSISKFTKNDEYLYCTAKSHQTGDKCEYRVSRVLDSEGQWNVYERPLDGTDEDWQWVDAISEEVESRWK